MTGILLTQYTGAILGPIAKYILGPIINLVFKFFDLILFSFDKGLVGLSIIGFTIVVYICMLPLTIRQQKFSKLQALMNPEIQAIQAKYKNKRDNESMMAMQAETKAVYAKYGTSPSGSCLQLLIQMPILFALYRVIYSLPAYITTLKEHFTVLADNVIGRGLVDHNVTTFVDGNPVTLNAIQNLQTSATHLGNFQIDQTNAVIDCLNSMNHDTLNSYFASQPECVDSLQKINDYNSFLGMNLTNSPMQMLSEAWNNPSGIKWGLLIGAILIPLLAGATQWINTKLMPQPANNSTNPNDPGASMGQSLKVMNNIMPIMSIVFVFSFSAGIGIYWIAGSVVRTVQQVIINKKMDKVNVDELIKKNLEKRRQKMIKKGLDPDKVDKYAKINTKNINTNNMPVVNNKKSMNQKAAIKNVKDKDKDEAFLEAVETDSKKKKNYAPGSLASKANLVSEYNNRNKK